MPVLSQFQFPAYLPAGFRRKEGIESKLSVRIEKGRKALAKGHAVRWRRFDSRRDMFLEIQIDCRFSFRGFPLRVGTSHSPA